MEEPIIYHANLRPTPQQVDQIRLKDENQRLKEEIEDWKKQIKELEEEIKSLKENNNTTSCINLEQEYMLKNKIKELEEENDKLNKLVDAIYNETYSIKPFNHVISDINNMISNYRNPSIVGTTQTVEIDGNNYEVQVIKKAKKL